MEAQPRPRRAPARRAARQWDFGTGEVPDSFEPAASELVRRVLWSRREIIGPDVDAFLAPDLLPSR